VAPGDVPIDEISYFGDQLGEAKFVDGNLIPSSLSFAFVLQYLPLYPYILVDVVACIILSRICFGVKLHWKDNFTLKHRQAVNC
jgi:hypothetical protein